MVAGLLLAAGAGRRLGGRPKALLPFRGGLLVEHAAQTLALGGCDPVYVVLGAADVPSLEGCIKVHNGEWATGMASSLRAGLAALSPETSAVVVLLVDQPGITPEAVRRVISAHDQDAAVAVATYRGERGHPILFDRAHFRAISQSATGDSGARAFLREHPELVTAVPCDDIADPADIDFPADLDRLDR